MSVESDIYSALTGYAGLSALVSTRVYPQVIPDGATLPAVAYQRVGTEPVQTLHGTVPAARARFSFSAWAATYADALSVIAQVRAALLAAAAFEAVYEFEVDLFDEESRRSGRIADFSIWALNP